MGEYTPRDGQGANDQNAFILPCVFMGTNTLFEDKEKNVE